VAGLRSDDDNIMESLRLAANACIGVGDPPIDGLTLTFPCTVLGWSSMISKLLCSLTLEWCDHPQSSCQTSDPNLRVATPLFLRP